MDVSEDACLHIQASSSTRGPFCLGMQLHGVTCQKTTWESQMFYADICREGRRKITIVVWFFAAVSRYVSMSVCQYAASGRRPGTNPVPAPSEV